MQKTDRTGRKILMSLLLAAAGVLAMVVMYCHDVPYTAYLPVLLGSIAAAAFLLASCALFGILRHKNIEQTKIRACAKWVNLSGLGIALMVFDPMILIELWAMRAPTEIMLICFLAALFVSVFLTALSVRKCMSVCRCAGTENACPCRKTHCAHYADCAACRAKHRRRHTSTSCVR